jgi:hypothetical protein
VSGFFVLIILPQAFSLKYFASGFSSLDFCLELFALGMWAFHLVLCALGILFTFGFHLHAFCLELSAPHFLHQAFCLCYFFLPSAFLC